MTSKPWWKSKTVWFNVGSIAVDVASGALGIPIPPKVAGYVLVAGNLILRTVTKSAITATDQPAS